MIDILAELDAAIAEADSTTDALCAQFLEDAMVGVRAAIDGSMLATPICDSLDCHGATSGAYGCEDTMARWRAPEDGEPVVTGPSPVAWLTIGFDGTSPLVVLDETHAWGSHLDFRSITARFAAFGRSLFTTMQANDDSLSNFSWADAIAGWEADYERPQRWTIDRWVTAPAAFAPKPKPMNPPARDLDVITRFHAYLNPGDFVLPRSTWHFDEPALATGPDRRRRSQKHRSWSRGYW